MSSPSSTHRIEKALSFNQRLRATFAATSAAGMLAFTGGGMVAVGTFAVDHVAMDLRGTEQSLQHRILPSPTAGKIMAAAGMVMLGGASGGLIMAGGADAATRRRKQLTEEKFSADVADVRNLLQPKK